MVDWALLGSGESDKGVGVWQHIHPRILYIAGFLNAACLQDTHCLLQEKRVNVTKMTVYNGVTCTYVVLWGHKQCPARYPVRTARLN